MEPSPRQVSLTLQITEQAFSFILFLSPESLVLLAVLDLLSESFAFVLGSFSLKQLFLVVIAVFTGLVDTSSNLLRINAIHASLVLQKM